jgi:hypothetical protein
MVCMLGSISYSTLHAFSLVGLLGLPVMPSRDAYVCYKGISTIRHVMSCHAMQYLVQQWCTLAACYLYASMSACLPFCLPTTLSASEVGATAGNEKTGKANPQLAVSSMLQLLSSDEQQSKTVTAELRCMETRLTL